MNLFILLLFYIQQIELDDVGPLLKIRVGHDGKGAFAGWFLDKVSVFIQM